MLKAMLRRHESRQPFSRRRQKEGDESRPMPGVIQTEEVIGVERHIPPTLRRLAPPDIATAPARRARHAGSRPQRDVAARSNVRDCIPPAVQ
jgi:hypothetical protein